MTKRIADADRSDWHLAVHHRERHVHLFAPDGPEEGLQLLLVHPPALRPPLHFQPPARAGQESTLPFADSLSTSDLYCSPVLMCETFPNVFPMQADGSSEVLVFPRRSWMHLHYRQDRHAPNKVGAGMQYSALSIVHYLVSVS